MKQNLREMLVPLGSIHSQSAKAQARAIQEHAPIHESTNASAYTPANSSANTPMNALANGRARAMGYIYGLLGAVFFSMKAIFIKLAYIPIEGQTLAPIDPITLMVLRMGFAFPVYTLILIWFFYKASKARAGFKNELRIEQETDTVKHKPSKLTYVKASLLGALCYYLCAYLDFTGLQYITAQLERLLLFTYPVFVMVLGALFFGRKISRYGVISIILAYLGIAVIFVGGDLATGSNLWLGTGLILLTALFFAIFQLMAVRYIVHLGSEVFTCIAVMSASCVVFIHFLIVNHGALTPLLVLPFRVYMIGILLATVSTLLPSFMVNMALGRIGAQSVSTLGMLGPVATIIFAVTLLGEPFGFVDALGTAIVMSAIAIYTFFDKKQTSHKTH